MASAGLLSLLALRYPGGAFSSKPNSPTKTADSVKTPWKHAPSPFPLPAPTSRSELSRHAEAGQLEENDWFDNWSPSPCLLNVLARNHERALREDLYGHILTPNSRKKNDQGKIDILGSNSQKSIRLKRKLRRGHRALKPREDVADKLSHDLTTLFDRGRRLIEWEDDGDLVLEGMWPPFERECSPGEQQDEPAKAHTPN